MDSLRARVDRLERQGAALEELRAATERERAAMEQGRALAERRLRILGGLAVATVLATLLLPDPRAALAQGKNPLADLLARMATVETALANETAARQAGDGALQADIAAAADKLVHFSRVGDDVFITGANLHLRNGLGATATTNSLGNLIVGYNERTFTAFERTGSHNLVVGSEHGWDSFGGFVAGQFNRILAPFASVSGGSENTASSAFASVSGGRENAAAGDYASISGGGGNRALGTYASVSGGELNQANGDLASISGGKRVETTITDGWGAGSRGATTFVGDFRSP
jgi:hypothetical protein